jgi:site-specific DNA-adenine methylase
MKTNAGTLAAPFPYFGGKSGACETVWSAFGAVDNYVEPFCGSAAMLLGAPDGKRVETINDADGFVANFWRAVGHDAEAVAQAADWPCNEVDLFARHSWLVRQAAGLTERMHADPDYYDAKIAGWWCWGSCNWIGTGWCSGTGPWIHDGVRLVNARERSEAGNAGRGVNRQLPHLGNAGQGVNRKLPHLGDAGQGVNGHSDTDGFTARSYYIHEWFSLLQARMRDVRVTCGDWTRVLKDSVTTRHGLTGVFLDPPYTKGEMDYAAGGVGTDLPLQVQAWCAQNGSNKALRIVLCGHAGEHDALLAHGWQIRTWTARKGYALTDEAIANSANETVWCSPHCNPEVPAIADLFAEASF